MPARLPRVRILAGVNKVPVREDLPGFIQPMLASGGALPDGEDWAFEVKWDGARAQIRCDGNALSIRSRSGRSFGEEFPEVRALLDPLAGRRVVLDGELVCLASDGMPDFAALRARLGGAGRARTTARQRKPAILIIFDVLHCDGLAIRHLPYLQRREVLSELDLGEGPAWRTPRRFSGRDGRHLAAVTREHGVEGVVAKRLSAAYSAGRRSSAWVKHKHRRSEWFVVTGWRERTGALPEFLLARRRGEGLVPAGSASFGLDAERRALLLSVLTEHELRPAWARSPMDDAACRGVGRLPRPIERRGSRRRAA